MRQVEGFDLSSPFVDAVLPDGSRLHVVIPDITAEHWAVNIRKFVSCHSSGLTCANVIGHRP
jgi:Flp pilus assembly CpaF family ATPase